MKRKAGQVTGNKISAGFQEQFKKACTNCGETNYHTENDISFITGKSGFHVCNVCGLKSLGLPKLSLKEIKKLKSSFSKKPKVHFEKPDKRRELISFIFMFAIIIVLLFFALIRI